jgi:hypothetical protein
VARASGGREKLPADRPPRHRPEQRNTSSFRSGRSAPKYKNARLSCTLYSSATVLYILYSTVIWVVVSYSYVLYSTIPGHVYRIAHMATPAPRCSCCYAMRSESRAAPRAIATVIFSFSTVALP